MTVDLPERLELPLASGAPYWYFLGGRPSLDLVNTLRERWSRRVETLVGPSDLSEWLGRVGLVPGPCAADSGDLQATRELREAIDGLVVASIAGERPRVGAVATLDGWLRRAERPMLDVVDGVLELRRTGAERPVEDALARIALDAADMLGTQARGRVRICASDTCSARFFDASNASRRRWCSMAACGNRAKARRHRASRTTKTGA